MLTACEPPCGHPTRLSSVPPPPSTPDPPQVDEAKQFYPLFGLGANVALIFSGRAVKLFSQVRARVRGRRGDGGSIFKLN